MSAHRYIFVAGLHRSGTSLIARFREIGNQIGALRLVK